MTLVEEESTVTDGPDAQVERSGTWVFAGRYEVLSLLGVGGMGSVYRVFDRELEEVVALKVIRRDLVGEPGIVDRFRREVKLARRVTHRNVARVYDLGEAEGQRYFTMEYVDGPSLAREIERGVLDLAAVLRIGAELADALATAHAAGVIHRDLKPDNVIVASDGRVVVTDFGIARSLASPSSRATLAGSLIGTPVYMAPELVAGKGPADARSDVFAVGVILYEALTGELPWSGPNDMVIAIARLNQEATPLRALRPDVPAALEDLIHACIARDPGARLPSAAELVRAVGAVRATVAAHPSLAKTLPLARAPRHEPAPSTLSHLTTGVFSIGRMPDALGPARSGARTVAVLPFATGASQDHGYLADGFTEAVIDALSSSPTLRVRPRGMVMRYRGSQLDLASLGRALEAQVLVTGYLERSESGLAAEVRVISVEDGFPLWAGTIRRSTEDVFAMGEDVARVVAFAIGSEASELALAAPASGARDLYLQARHAYHAFWMKGASRAVRLFEQAMRAAPDDGVVLVGYALACIRESFFTGKGMSQARAAIERAAQLTPDAAEVAVARAWLASQDGDPVTALYFVKAALLRAPALAEANWFLGRLLLEADLLDAAVQRLEWAVALEPEQHLARRELARAHALAGRFSETERIAAEEPPGQEIGIWLDRARYAVWSRDAAGARAHLSRLPSSLLANEAETGPVHLSRALLQMVAEGAAPFRDPALQDFVLRTRGTSRRDAFIAQIEAEIFAFLGQDGDALRALESAAASGLGDLAWVERCPLLAPLRGSARFEAARSTVAARAAAVRDAVYSA
jgi:serine/threonine-protein kinase